MIDPIVEQMAALHDYAPLPFAVRLFSSADLYGQTSDLARTPYGQAAQASGQTQELALSEPRLRNLDPRADLQLIPPWSDPVDDRLLGAWPGPVGLLQGVAQYSEMPTPEIEVNARASTRRGGPGDVELGYTNTPGGDLPPSRRWRRRRAIRSSPSSSISTAWRRGSAF